MILMILGSATVSAIVVHILSMKKSQAETLKFKAETENLVVNNALGLVESLRDEVNIQREEVRKMRDLMNIYIASEITLTAEMNKLKAENVQLRIELETLKNESNGKTI